MRKKQYCAGFFRSAVLVALAVLADSSATSRNPPAFRDAHRRNRREFLSGERAAALFDSSSIASPILVVRSERDFWCS
jgi:hypothetical protein